MNILEKHRKILVKKKILRDIYSDWYSKIISCMSKINGKSLEIGSGTGNFKEYKPDIISSDIDPQPWLDMKIDAHHIPFKNGELSNIVMIDVLHHLANPIIFLNEAYRVLNKGGRLLMIEPYPSFFSLIVYKLFHPEPFIKNIDYYSPQNNTENKTPWESNQAIPFLIFFKNIKKFNKLFSNKFKIIKKERFSFILYPLSGGFENKQIIPNILVPLVKFYEILLKPFNYFFAFRCFLVLEKI